MSLHLFFSIIASVKKVYLSIIIPCYDEMANLQKGVLDKVKSFLEKKKFSYEVIVVDDGSTDGSEEFLSNFIKENPQFRLIEISHFGKAGAVTKGMLEAKGELVMFSDMDQATPIEELDKLLPYFDEGYDVVIGSRSGRRKGSPWTRQLMSRSWMMLRNLVIGLGITDTQCGFKMFRHEAAVKLFKKIDALHHGFRLVGGSSVSAGFDVELLYLAQQYGYKIKEVTVAWLYVETRRVNPIFDSLEALGDLVRIKKDAIAGKYKNL